MVKNKILFFLSGILLIVYSCNKEFDKFERPEWLQGKLYTQIKSLPELSTFAECLELTGYDDIIDVSGSYTVFSPTNDAFDAFFANSPDYNSVNDIPLNELERIVEYHIIQNSWSKRQLSSFDVYGWIDTLDVNNDKPRGFKRSTILLEDNRKYGIKYPEINIIDTLQAENTRVVATDSRKYVPIFFPEYLNINKLSSEDYEFYFDRPFEAGNNLYIANGKVVSDEIKAENGIVYMIDQVVLPLNNAYQFLENKEGANSYASFLDLVNKFPRFEYNNEKTFDQAGAEQGMEVDSLFDLSFPRLTFDLTSERTKPPVGTSGMPSNVTTRYHHGMLVPTDQAYEDFLNEYLSIPGGWGSLETAPDHISRIIANTHLSFEPVYLSDVRNGFINGEMDNIKVDESHIIEKKFGSNTTFIGLDKAIVPRAFSSVTGPVYLQRGYSKVMYAIEQTKLLPTLKRKNENYMLFVESDNNSAVDSSLIYLPVTNDFLAIIKGEIPTEFKLSRASLRTLLLNHIAMYQPRGVARKEYIPNMAGNYLIFNNETGEVSGTAPTTYGYQGDEEVPEFPKILSVADNGTTYDIENWFSFSVSPIFASVSNNFPEFHKLLRKAGLVLESQYRYSFINESDYYTIFAPNKTAIENSNLNDLPVDELRKALLLHFVRGSLIFTDGNMPAGYYPTSRKDEKSTPFSTIFSSIYIEPGIDKIGFRGKDGSLIANLEESENTNILTSILISEDEDSEEVYPNIINNGVIHEIDKVLNFEELDTK